ncbi:MAG TPA: hypothetical protein VIG30_08525 [Ktedonobacterales bacterium]|jgi:predicted transcriptional regulator
MSKTIELTNEQYATLQRIAQATKTTPDAMIAEWVKQLDNWDQSAFYTDEEWKAHLDDLDRQGDGDANP